MNIIATFSIVAFDPAENAWGIAVASKFPAVGAVVPWARAGAGAVATQSYANTTYGPRGLEMMASGISAQEALDELIKEDDERALRQAGIVDASGRSATFTGEDCFEWAGGITGEHFTVQGNILAGPQVVEAMAQAFQSSSEPFPERLQAALLAGDRAGGDRRGRQSAAIFVVKPEGGYGRFNDRWIDYRVDDHEDPVPRLGEMLKLHRLYFDESAEGDILAIEGEVLEQLQRILLARGYEIASIGDYDQITRKALREFIGNENFEDRTDVENGQIDAPVYAYLIEKFSS
ncbi:MAG: DUF1028 domain-containing protein [Anaerolineales bacterium]|nr:DUF1028 domain-containing protein [Anaerolineales bacterium]